MKPPFNFLNIVAENGGRGHIEVTVCMYGQHPQESIDGPAMAAIPASDNKGKYCFPCPRSRLRNWFRGTGSAVPSCVSPVILYRQAESSA